MNPKHILPSLAAALFACGTATAIAQSYPDRPIRMIVPYPPGGSPDALARRITQDLEQQLGKPIVVDNRSGASGLIGIEIAARSQPNGYTLLAVTSSFTTTEALQVKPTFTVARDFTAVSLLGEFEGHLLALHPSVPAKNVPEFIAFAKKSSQHVTFASSGSANFSRLVGEFFNLKAGTKLVNVPYRGSGPAMLALFSGEVHSMFVAASIAHGPIKAGKLRAIGSSGTKRLTSLPEVPLISESVPDFRIDGGYVGIVAPAKTPTPIVNRLHGEIKRALANTKTREFYVNGGYIPVDRSPAEFQKFLEAEVPRFRELGRIANIKLE